jgi:hypothetical protein
MEFCRSKNLLSSYSTEFVGYSTEFNPFVFHRTVDESGLATTAVTFNPFVFQFGRSYSLWINFQESHLTDTKYDICLYGYCTYYQLAKTSSGVINVNAQ